MRCDFKGEDRFDFLCLRMANTYVYCAELVIFVYSFNPQINPMTSELPLVPFLQLGKWRHTEAKSLAQDSS